MFTFYTTLEEENIIYLTGKFQQDCNEVLIEHRTPNIISERLFDKQRPQFV
jgi:hypothetical protein